MHTDPASLGEGPFLTLPEVAKVLRVSRAKAYQMAQTGELPSVKIGTRVVRVRRDALAAWIDSQAR